MKRAATIDEYKRCINRIVEYIDAHIGENIDVSTLADMSCFSAWHFHRIAKAFLGEPVGRFIARKKVETAARLLRYSDLTIAEICYRSGYEQPSSLCKSFREFYGFSPNEYRKNKNLKIMKPEKINLNLDIQFSIKNVEPKRVLYVQLLGEYASLDFCKAWWELFEFGKLQNAFGAQPEYIGMYHDDPKVTAPEKLRSDVCLTIANDVKPHGKFGVRTLAGGKCASFLYKGSYANLGTVYDTIYSTYIPKNNLSLRDSDCFEIYHNDPETEKPENLLTEIFIPIE